MYYFTTSRGLVALFAFVAFDTIVGVLDIFFASMLRLDMSGEVVLIYCYKIALIAFVLHGVTMT